MTRLDKTEPPLRLNIEDTDCPAAWKPGESCSPVMGRDWSCMPDSGFKRMRTPRMRCRMRSFVY